MAINNNKQNSIPTFKNKNRDHGYVLNEAIRASEVRLISDSEAPVVCSINDALNKAREAGLDLVMISAQTSPPVCKITDFQKLLYEKKKKEKEMKTSNKSTLKEVKLSPQIGDHDVQHKVKQSIEFLTKGHKVKAYIQFKGRQMSHKEQGEKVILLFLQALEEVGRPESLPKLEGKNMFVIITPKK